MSNIKELGRNLVNFAKTETTGVSYAFSRGHYREVLERIVIGIPSDFQSLINETFHSSAAVHQYTLTPLIDRRGRRDLRLRGYGSLREGGINFYLYNRRTQNREGMEAARFQHFRERALFDLLFSLEEGEILFVFLPHGKEIDEGVAMARFTKKNGKFEAQSQLLPELSENEAECLLGGLENLGGRRVFMSEGKNSPLWVGIRTRGEVFNLVERQEEFKGWTAGLLGQGFWQRGIPTCQDCKVDGLGNLGSSVVASDQQSTLRVPLVFSPSCGGSEVGMPALQAHASRDSLQTLTPPSNEFGNFSKVKDMALRPPNSEKSLPKQLPVGGQLGENALSTARVSPGFSSYRQVVDVAERRRQEGINIPASKEAPEFRLRDYKKAGETVVWEGVPIPLPDHGVIFERTPETIQKCLELKPCIPTTEVIVARNMAEAVYSKRNTDQKYIAIPELLVLPVRHFVIPDKQIPEMQFDVKDFVDASECTVRRILPLDSLPTVQNDRGFAEAIGIRDEIRGKDTVLVNSDDQTADSVLVGTPTVVLETHSGIYPSYFKWQSLDFARDKEVDGYVPSGIVIVRSSMAISSNLITLGYVSSPPIEVYESNPNLKPEEQEIEKLELAFEPALRRGRFGGGLGRNVPTSVKLQYAFSWQKLLTLFVLSGKAKVGAKKAGNVIFDNRVLAYDGILKPVLPSRGSYKSYDWRDWEIDNFLYDMINHKFKGRMYAILS